MSAWVDVAVLTGTKTLDGRLVVRSAQGLPFLLSEGVRAYFMPPQIDVPRSGVVEEIAEGNGGDYIVRFDSVRDKTKAGLLLGSHVLVSRDDLDELEAAWAESSFIGFEVIDQEMGLLGEVANLLEMPAQYVLSVQKADAPEEDDFLIPFVDEFIVDVNSDAQVITVHVSKSLLDL